MRWVVAIWLLSGCQLALGLRPIGDTATDAAGTDAAPAVPIDIVQFNAGPLPSAATSIPVVMPNDQLAGDLNVVFIAHGDTFTGVASVSDSNGNSYKAQIMGSHQVAYYAANIAGGPNTVTVTFNSSTTYPDVRVLEYQGIAAANPLDDYHSTDGNGLMMTSGAVMTTHAYDLLVAGNSVGGHTSDPDPLYTQRLETNPNGNIAEDRIVTNTGTYDATAIQTATTDDSWTISLLAFKGAADAPP